MNAPIATPSQQGEGSGGANDMKKMYIAPAVEINKTQVQQMMALSFQEGAADSSEPLGKEEAAWDIWGSEEKED